MKKLLVALPALALVLVFACGDDDARSPSGDVADALTDAADSSADSDGADDTSATEDADAGDLVAPDSSADADDSGVSDALDGDLVELPNVYASPGPWPVGHATLALRDEARERDLTVELWYPAAAAGDGGETLVDYGADEERRSALASWLDEAPAECPRRETASTRDLEAAGGEAFPLVVFSHCHECTRFSSLEMAEWLASHGFVVAAPDHAGNTLFDAGSEDALPLDTETLALRVGDMRFVLDTVLGEAPPLPAGLTLDAERVGAFGHSFGSVTTGALASADERVRAAVGVAAPMENPLLPGVTIEDVDVPLLFFLAQEDNSITILGNQLIEQNVDEANPPVTLVEVADAGHWSFSDLCGLVEAFMPCCGEDRRQTNRAAFTYLDPALGRTIGAAFTTAFFASTLRGDAEGSALLARPPADWPVTVRSRQ